jgi:hypothetical protein
MFVSIGEIPKTLLTSIGTSTSFPLRSVYILVVASGSVVVGVVEVSGVVVTAVLSQPKMPVTSNKIDNNITGIYMYFFFIECYSFQQDLIYLTG